MKALVTQFSAIGLPPSEWAIAGSATAGPVKVSGIAAAAAQMPASARIRLDMSGLVMSFPPVRKRGRAALRWEVYRRQRKQDKFASIMR